MAKALTHPQYLAHRHVPIARSNYTVGRQGQKPQYVVIHLMAGTYEGSISWAQNPASNVSWHFAVARNGHTTHNLSESNSAWTNSSWWHNIRSVTIEHEGFLSHGGFSEAQMHASAKITAGICYRHNIPIDRAHIFGHTEIKGVSKPCPGPMDWPRYIKLVRAYARKGTPSTPAQPSNPPKKKPAEPETNEIPLKRINICFEGNKDKKTAEAYRTAINALSRWQNTDSYARIVGGGPNIRYAAEGAWNSTDGYINTVVIGRPAVKELAEYMQKALAEDSASGRLIAADGDGWEATNEIAAWRLSYHCDVLAERVGFDAQEAKDVAIPMYEEQMGKG